MDTPNQSGPASDSLEGREDEDMIYLSDDDERERDGVHNSYLDDEEKRAATRNDLLRQVESLEQDALDWLEFNDDPNAQTAYDMIVELHEFLGETPEESDD